MLKTNSKLTEIVEAAIDNDKSYLIPTNQEWAKEIEAEMRQNYIKYKTLLNKYKEDKEATT